MIIREGAKMSKTQGNVVIPDEYIEQWGADAFRTYLMFLGPYEEGGDFRDQSITGVAQLPRPAVGVGARVGDGRRRTRSGGACASCTRRSGRSARTCRVLAYNTAIAAMMEYMNVVRRGERTAHRDEVEPLVQLVCAVRAAHRRGAVGAVRTYAQRVRLRAGPRSKLRWSQRI